MRTSAESPRRVFCRGSTRQGGTYTPLLSRPCSPEMVCLQLRSATKSHEVRDQDAASSRRERSGSFSRYAPEGSTNLVTLRNVSVFYLRSSIAAAAATAVLGNADRYSRIGRSGGEPVGGEDVQLAIWTRLLRCDGGESRAIAKLEGPKVRPVAIVGSKTQGRAVRKRRASNGQHLSTRLKTGRLRRGARPAFALTISRILAGVG